MARTWVDLLETKEGLQEISGGESGVVTPDRGPFRMASPRNQASSVVLPTGVGDALRMRLLSQLVGVVTLAACASVDRDTWQPLISPGSFDGWHEAPGGSWRWEGDVLIGSSPKSEKRHGLLISDARYADFIARIEFRAVSGCSGFYFRVDETESNTGVRGFQAEVEPNFETGGLYETAGRAWVVRPDPELVASVYRPGEWAEMTVTALGGDIEVRVNGTVTAKLEDDPGRREGHFALQLHGSQDLRVEFRNLRVKLLGDLSLGNTME